MSRTKILIICVSVLILFIIGIITYQAATITQGPKLVLDFENKNQIISSYAGLLGALLSFLSIMFVIYNIIEDREKVNKDKQEKQIEIFNEYDNRLKVIDNFLTTIIKDIDGLGANLNKLAKEELDSPSSMNYTRFPVNKNFKRFVELDSLVVYKVFKYKFSGEKNWEKTYTDLYKIIDFYEELLPHIQEKFEGYLEEKVSSAKDVGLNIDNLMTISQKLIDSYRNKNDMKNPYLKLCSDFNYDLHFYLRQQQDAMLPQNMRYIGDTFIKPLIEGILSTRNQTQFETQYEEEILHLGSKIRRGVFLIEQSTRDFANHLKEQYEVNFSTNSKNLNNLKKIKKGIEKKAENNE